MKITICLLVAAIAFPGLVSMSHAGTTDLGTLPVPTTITVSDSNLGIGSFSDAFQFQVGSNAAIVDAQTSVYFSGSGSFQSFSSGVQLNSVVLYQGGNSIANATPNISYSPIPGLGGNYSYNYLLSYIPLSVGQQYSLVISGLVVGSSPGNYSGSLVTVPVPVPETKEWAMMLVGLGLVLFQVHRKQRKLIKSTLNC